MESLPGTPDRPTSVPNDSVAGNEAELAAPSQVAARRIGVARVLRLGAWRDYVALGKPLIVLLLLATTWAGMVVAAGRLPPAPLVFWTLLGGGLTAAGASALNQYIDRDLDALMVRTRRRPLPGGRLEPRRAAAFGAALCLAGVVILALAVNLLSAFLAALGALYYVGAYSLVLKKATPQNIVIGGGAGAIPPLVGWAAVAGSLAMPALFLFAIIFFWTPPHFWALALTRQKDYARTDVPMLPVVYGDPATRWAIFLYSIQLVALTLLLPSIGIASTVYLLAALALGVIFISRAWSLLRAGGTQRAWALYRYSSMYLALIFGAMVLDTLVSIPS
jgi:protoheme IX farnesyltransferase